MAQHAARSTQVARNGQESQSRSDLTSHANRLEFALAQDSANVAVNAAFLQEIKEDDVELRARLAELHARCLCPIGPAECQSIIDQLRNLSDALLTHFSLEEAYGYFDDPLAVAPHLRNKAARLRSEHHGLHTALIDLIEWAEHLFRDMFLPRHSLSLLRVYLGPRVLKFEDLLRRHDLEEQALIWDAYSTDIGVGD